MIANAASGNISIHFGLRGPNTTVSTACSSAAHAIGDSLAAIRHGLRRRDGHRRQRGRDHAAWAWAASSPAGPCPSATTTRAHASRPFDKDRDGFVLSEGAGVLVLEEYERAKARGATIYAEVCGSGNTADAFHITAPHEDGIGAAEAMRGRDSRRRLELPTTCSTSTPTAPAPAWATWPRRRPSSRSSASHAKQLMISSTKSMIGHLLGASRRRRGDRLCPEPQARRPAPDDQPRPPGLEAGCDLDYIPNRAREVRVKKLLSNSFGFGGHNCSLALGAI